MSLHATTQTIVNAFTDFGLEQLVGGRLCFINLTRDFLVGSLPVPFDPGKAVLEILPDVDIDDEVLAGSSRLVNLGYQIAITHTLSGDGYYELRRLSSYVKVDISKEDQAEVKESLRQLREFPTIKLIAEHVDTDKDLEFAQRSGIDFLQGRALGRPQVLKTQSLSVSRLRRLELLGALNDEDINLTTIVDIVAADPGLSFRVLRATNSASSGLNRQVSSVRDAIVLLGLVRIRQWVALMVVSDVAESASDSQLEMTMARARLCETVAERLGARGDSAFMVGLLAGIADLLREPVAELIRNLPLTAEVEDALIRGSGRLGQILAMVRAYEATDNSVLRGAPVSSADLAKAYLAAVGWSVRIVDGVVGGTGPRRLPPVERRR